MCLVPVQAMHVIKELSTVYSDCPCPVYGASARLYPKGVKIEAEVGRESGICAHSPLPPGEGLG